MSTHEIIDIKCDCGFVLYGNEHQTDRELLELLEQHQKEKHPFVKWKVSKWTPKL